MIPALRRLLDHPSSTVADQAATALKEAGEVFTMPAKAGPARYRITVDGEPYANRRVAWAFVAGSSLGSEVTTSPDGIAELSRDTFLEVKNIQRLALRSTEMPDPSQPWFGALLPPPPSSAEPLPVEIRTQSQKITLDLPRSDADLAGQTMEVTLWGGQDAENQKIGFWSPAKFSLPASRELVLAKIQPGMYRMEVRIPGFTTSIGPLRAGKSGNVAIPFRRASDVKFTALLPPGWHPNFLLPELRQGGTRVDSDWDHEKLLFRGVPEGGYTLHIPSSAEVRKRVIGLLPDGPEFAGVEVPFEVKADSPTRLDLGEIRLK